MKPVVISWGFNPYNGKIFLDCYLDIDDKRYGVTDVYMMEIRGNTQGTTLALLKIPKEEGRQYIEEYINLGDKSVLELLKSAKISAREITRKGHKHSAIDFITCER